GTPARRANSARDRPATSRNPRRCWPKRMYAIVGGADRVGRRPVPSVRGCYGRQRRKEARLVGPDSAVHGHGLRIQARPVEARPLGESEVVTDFLPVDGNLLETSQQAGKEPLLDRRLVLLGLFLLEVNNVLDAWLDGLLQGDPAAGGATARLRPRVE